MFDPAPITRYLRAKASSQLLVAAVIHLKVFEELASGPKTIETLQEKLGLKHRPAMVLFPALLAMGMVSFDAESRLGLTAMGQFLTSGNHVNLIGYVELEKDEPGVVKMVEWLQNDGPRDNRQGMSYVKDNDAPSPMDDPDTARFYTMALAGRAKYLAPLVAGKMTRHSGVLLDVAGGTGYYTFEWLLQNPYARAIVFDRAEVLKVSGELLEELILTKRPGVDTLPGRVSFLAGDMLTDPLPEADMVLAASLFHDWPVDTCEYLARKFAAAIRPGGELWVHDAFLNDSLDGPIAVTDYSAMLFLGTRGRAYSRKEYRQWLSNAGLIPVAASLPTMLDYSLIWAQKPASEQAY